ncbi:MAG: winged helix-turn-helix transcriptional regulator [Anaerolineae bacterium]|nr:winged helix-turn-helix transcriptional regulator [Anaerolineae bacterium]
MLKKILSLIASGEATTQSDLVRALDIPEPLLAEMVERLEDQGYLTEDALCVEACDGCSLKMRCGNDRQLRIWTLTEKGIQAATS